MSLSYDTQKLRDEIIDSVKEYKGNINTLERRLEGIEAQLKHADDGGHFGGSSRGWEGPGSQIDEAALKMAQQSGLLRVNVGHLWKGHEVGYETKTLIDSTAVGSSTPGILVPRRVPGIVPLAKRRLTVRDLLRSRPTSNNAVEFLKENVFTNAASPQTEGNAKAESANTFTIDSEKVQTLAHWIPATKQILQDLPGLRDFIDRNLLYGLKLIEEWELLFGTGVDPHMHGLCTQATAYAGTYNAAGDTRLDKLRHAIAELEAVDEQVDMMVLNPVDMHYIDLIKTEDGGANKGSYVLNVPTGPTLVKTLWNVPVVSTNAMPLGKFALGDSTKCEIFDSMDAVIEISDSHSTYFTENKVAIRAEERLTLAVYRGGAFRYGSF